jgi:hypothetical protein
MTATSNPVDQSATFRKRHLAAVDPPRRFLDRRNQPFVPVYPELTRTGTDGKGRIGFELSPGAAYFYSVLLARQGLVTDGRRASQVEREGEARFRPQDLSAGDFVSDYGWTYETVQGLAKECARPHPCWHCGRAHPLIRVEHTPGCRNRYIILRCQELRDEECLPLSMIERPKRVPTGAAAGVRFAREDPQQPTLPLETVRPCRSLSDLDSSEALRHCRSVTDLDSSETVQPYQTISSDLPPQNDVEARLMILKGIVKLNGLTVASDVLRAIATDLQITGAAELEKALIGAVVAASVQRAPITATLVAETLAKQASSEQQVSDGRFPSDAAASKPTDNIGQSRVHQPAGPTDKVGGFARSTSSELTDNVGQLSRAAKPFGVRNWATERILELARQCEPGTTLGQAAKICDEFYRRCVEHVGSDVAAAESELQRIVTDPRFCGTTGRKPPRKPIALMRTAFREGWIWTRAEDDDGGGQFARAFAELAPGAQAEVARLFRAHAADGTPLELSRLRHHGISSKGMIAFCRARFGAPPS